MRSKRSRRHAARRRIRTIAERVALKMSGFDERLFEMKPMTVNVVMTKQQIEAREEAEP